MGSVCAAGAETGQCASLDLSRIRLYSLYISEKENAACHVSTDFLR